MQEKFLPRLFDCSIAATVLPYSRHSRGNIHGKLRHTSTLVAASHTRTVGLIPASPDATNRPFGLTRREVTCLPSCPRKYRWLFEVKGRGGLSSRAGRGGKHIDDDDRNGDKIWRVKLTGPRILQSRCSTTPLSIVSYPAYLIPMCPSAVHNTDRSCRINQSPQPVVGEASSRQPLTSDSSN